MNESAHADYYERGNEGAAVTTRILKQQAIASAKACFLWVICRMVSIIGKKHPGNERPGESR
jgi:hypothetical protein